MHTATNLILADCDPAEIADFQLGLQQESGLDFAIISARSNKLHGSALKKLRRYCSYFTLPLRLLGRRKEPGLIIGWQQFHAINFAFFMRMLRLKKRCRVVAVNFTYKQKPGLIGRIYERYMRFAVAPGYVDALHVPSAEYGRQLAQEFGFAPRDVIVTCFGTPDRHDEWASLQCPVENFALAIGRSNRDFDFLARVWSRPEIKNSGVKLVIISDTWHPVTPIDDNPAIIHLANVKGVDSFPYFARCEFALVPLLRSDICSGDTVLLNSMMMAKPVVITAPSTLAEMYIRHGENGICIPKDEARAAAEIERLITDPQLRLNLGRQARTSYLNSFSRTQMGRAIAAALK